MYEITVPDLNDSIGRISFEGAEYMIRFTWNPTYDYWTVGLYTMNLEPLLAGVKIVPNTSLFHYYKYTFLPYGVLVAMTLDDMIGRKDFVKKRAILYYLTDEEMNNIVGDDSWQTG